MKKSSQAPTARWTAGLLEARALTVRQPWAWLIVNGFKDIENRGRRTHYRGPVLIHAGLNTDEFNDETAARISKKYGVDIPETLEFGGIVGIADIVSCHDRHSSPWYVPGNFAWELANPRRLSFRACTGALGLFKPHLEP
ncbi:MAG: ASCH domain-containing protein [Betaproteobacteria bacterium]|nr:ASCH domain-containing protein [Betaproteobacteria bacterium]